MSPTIQARAEAAAKELNRTYAISFGNSDPEFARGVKSPELAAIIARLFADMEALRAAAEQAEKVLVESKELAYAHEDPEGELPTELIREQREVITALRAALTPDAAADGTKEET